MLISTDFGLEGVVPFVPLACNLGDVFDDFPGVAPTLGDLVKYENRVAMLPRFRKKTTYDHRSHGNSSRQLLPRFNYDLVFVQLDFVILSLSYTGYKN